MVLDCGKAAIDGNLRTGDETRFVRRQKDDQICDVIGIAKALQRVKGGKAGMLHFSVVRAVEIFSEHPSQHVAGAYSIAPDPVSLLPAKGSDRFGQGKDRPFARAIGEGCPVTSQRKHRGEIDDGAAARAPDARYRLATTDEGSIEIDAHDEVPDRLVALSNIVQWMIDASAVDEDIQLSIAVKDSTYRLLPTLHLCHVVMLKKAASAETLRCLPAVLRVYVRHTDKGAVLGKSNGALSSESRSPAGNQRDLVAEPFAHRAVLPPSMTISAPVTAADSSLAR